MHSSILLLALLVAGAFAVGVFSYCTSVIVDCSLLSIILTISLSGRRVFSSARPSRAAPAAAAAAAAEADAAAAPRYAALPSTHNLIPSYSFETALEPSSASYLDKI